MKSALIIILFFVSVSAHAQQTFRRVDDFLEFASKRSSTLQSNEIRLTRAKRASSVAMMNIIDPTGNTSLSFTDNTKLPTSLFPAEAFGGQPGTYRELQTGVQYNTAFYESVDIKLINLPGWENLTLTKLNVDLTKSTNQLTRKQFYENTVTAYYNIVNLKEQLRSMRDNLAIADTLQQITRQRYEEGLVKQQDVNDSKVNYLNTKESVKQLEYLIQQYYLSLKILCDIPDSDSIDIQDDLVMTDKVGSNAIYPNELNVINGVLKEQSALSSYRYIQKSLLPVLSFTWSFSSQLYNQDFKVLGGNWYSSNSIGLRLSLPMPSSVTISNMFNAKYDYELALRQTEKIRMQSQLEHRQLGNEFNKAVSQYQNNKEVMTLREDSYRKNLNLYAEGLMSLDQTLNSFSAMVNARLSLISSQISVLLAKSKITINNTVRQP